MEKVININFRGRVIPIEESAYEALKKYSDALSRYFANEESGDEIIADIESRIAELLAARLKQGASCININDLNAVIDSIGRVEDISAADGDEEKQERQQQAGSTSYNAAPAGPGGLFRNADDKMIAGVCSGLAARMNIDPVIMRVLFVLLFGALFWIYILLWLIVPLRSPATQVTHRLFRNPDDKVIAGVCGGLAVYFRMEVWKVRLVFLAPIIISMIFRSMDIFTWHMGLAPGFFFGSFGSAFFILYLILWIALPYANSSTERMEMRGEKIDINSIKAANQAKATSPASPQSRQSLGHSLGRVLAVLFKAFFLFVAGCVALGLFSALIGISFAGAAITPFTGFFLSSWQEHAMVWTGISLTLGIPLLALAVWLIRRIMGVRSRRHVLGYVFTALWIVGVVCALATIGAVVNNFKTRAVLEDEMQVVQPSNGKLYVNVSEYAPHTTARHSRWWGEWDEENDEFRLVGSDSLWLNNVRVNITQSSDSLFHVYLARASRAGNSADARNMAGHIAFDIVQQDSVLTLAKGFVISRQDKFRNQQVLLTIDVPIGKSVSVSDAVDNYSWYTINTGRHGVHYRHWNKQRSYDAGSEYIMTPSGLERVGGEQKAERKRRHRKIDNEDEDDEDIDVDVEEAHWD
ncbi:MAG: PspC domain-containing protein [Taibaiella sp.]|nr:PspC domain-containing protein [Taibaiella sp.]